MPDIVWILAVIAVITLFILGMCKAGSSIE